MTQIICRSTTYGCAAPTDDPANELDDGSILCLYTCSSKLFYAVFPYDLKESVFQRPVWEVALRFCGTCDFVPEMGLLGGLPRVPDRHTSRWLTEYDDTFVLNTLLPRILYLKSFSFDCVTTLSSDCFRQVCTARAGSLDTFDVDYDGRVPIAPSDKKIGYSDFMWVLQSRAFSSSFRECAVDHIIAFLDDEAFLRECIADNFLQAALDLVQQRPLLAPGLIDSILRAVRAVVEQGITHQTWAPSGCMSVSAVTAMWGAPLRQWLLDVDQTGIVRSAGMLIQALIRVPVPRSYQNTFSIVSFLCDKPDGSDAARAEPLLQRFLDEVYSYRSRQNNSHASAKSSLLDKCHFKVSAVIISRLLYVLGRCANVLQRHDSRFIKLQPEELQNLNGVLNAYKAFPLFDAAHVILYRLLKMDRRRVASAAAEELWRTFEQRAEDDAAADQDMNQNKKKKKIVKSGDDGETSDGSDTENTETDEDEEEEEEEEEAEEEKSDADSAASLPMDGDGGDWDDVDDGYENEHRTMRRNLCASLSDHLSPDCMSDSRATAPLDQLVWFPNAASSSSSSAPSIPALMDIIMLEATSYPLHDAKLMIKEDPKHKRRRRCAFDAMQLMEKLITSLGSGRAKDLAAKMPEQHMAPLLGHFFTELLLLHLRSLEKDSKLQISRFRLVELRVLRATNKDAIGPVVRTLAYLVQQFRGDARRAMVQAALRAANVPLAAARKLIEVVQVPGDTAAIKIELAEILR